MTTHPKLQTLYGLKFHPFRPDIPIDALHPTSAIDAFLRRVEYAIADGGFAMITGEPGCGKSIALRRLAHRLKLIPDLVVGTIEHPQSRTSDFYRELGELFGVPLALHNRFAGFQALRTRWSEHIATTMRRPVLIIDEAQETLTQVLGELRILASKDLDSRQLLCVIFAGDGRLPERLRTPELLPLGSRIRRRLQMEAASREELCACLDHVLEAAGSPALMTSELRVTLAEHALGNYRILMNMADELLAAAVERELPRLDEKLFLEVFQQAPRPAKATGSARKR
jgi:general secretion pathway protein A